MDQVTVKVNFLGELRSSLRRRDMEVCLADSSTIADLLSELSAQLGDRFKRQLFYDDGTLMHHVSIFVNGNDMKGLAGVNTLLAGGEVDVLILPTYGGG